MARVNGLTMTADGPVPGPVAVAELHRLLSVELARESPDPGAVRGMLWAWSVARQDAVATPLTLLRVRWYRRREARLARPAGLRLV